MEFVATVAYVLWSVMNQSSTLDGSRFSLRYYGYGRALVQRLDELLWYSLAALGGPQVLSVLVVRRALVVLSVLMIAGITLGAQISGLGIGWHFGEGKLMTILSVVMLLACGSICFRVASLRDKDAVPLLARKPARMWDLLGKGFLFLAADELFRIHENLDRTIHKLLGVKPVGLTDHLDDAIVGLYAFVMLAVLVKNLPELLHFTRALSYFVGACICGSLTIGLDFLASAKWLWLFFSSDLSVVQFIIDSLDVVEEMFKIYAEVFFIGALLSCLTVARQIFHEQAGALRPRNA